VPEGSKQCSVEDCGRRGLLRLGYCSKHYQKFKRHGDPLGGKDVPRLRGVPDLERFLTYTDRNGPVPSYRPDLGPCWLWLRSLTEGYGNFYFRGGPCPAHRASYELFVGPIPDGLHIDHLCRVKHCVNPAHLEPVTRCENARRGAHGMKTHCKHGHEYTPENTIHLGGKRRCRECTRRSGREFKRRKRAKAG
jgi:hypothetical protein